MLERRMITSKCGECQKVNSVPLSYFVGFDSKFEKSLIAKCQTCNKGFIVTFDESMIL